MARKPNNRGKSKGMPKNVQFKRQSGGSIKDMEKQFKPGASGDWFRIGKDEEYTVALLAMPTEWERIEEHTISMPNNQWAYVPCIQGCAVCKRYPDNSPRVYAIVPLYVYDYGRVQYCLLYTSPSPRDS